MLKSYLFIFCKLCNLFVCFCVLINSAFGKKHSATNLEQLSSAHEKKIRIARTNKVESTETNDNNMIDQKTPALFQSKLRQKDGKRLKLVMSDEFSSSGRTFRAGDDPIFEAVHKPDDTNEAIEFCKFQSQL
jgi:hypothetical protein